MAIQASPGPAPGFLRKPDHRIELRPVGRRVVGSAGGLTVVDSEKALVLLEAGLPPVWYFPCAETRLDRLTPMEIVTHCPFKGDASYWSLTTPVGTRADAAWSYETHFDEMAAIAGRLAFYWDALDHWSEDGVTRRDSPSLPKA
jgi:uncharacterized protein (DUF427 family)